MSMFLASALKKLIAIAEYNGLPIGRVREWYQTRLVPIGIFGDLNQKWLRRYKVRTVIDVGAHTGQFAKAIHKIFPDAGIYSFEPLKDCCDTLREAKTAIPSLEVFNVAVGRNAGTVEFRRNAFSPASSMLKMHPAHKSAFPFASKEEVVRVEMVRLDDLIHKFEMKDDVLVKLDVQGYEDQVLQGATKVLGAAKILIVEMSYRPLYEDQPLFDDVYKLIAPLGFRYVGNLNDFRDPMDGSVLQTDSVFIKKDSP